MIVQRIFQVYIYVLYIYSIHMFKSLIEFIYRHFWMYWIEVCKRENHFHFLPFYLVRIGQSSRPCVMNWALTNLNGLSSLNWRTAEKGRREIGPVRFASFLEHFLDPPQKRCDFQMSVPHAVLLWVIGLTHCSCCCGGSFELRQYGRLPCVGASFICPVRCSHACHW